MKAVAVCGTVAIVVLAHAGAVAPPVRSARLTPVLEVEHEADFPGPSPHSLGTIRGAIQGPAVKDVRVTDQGDNEDFAACHIQSETSLVSYGRYVYVGFNDGRDCRRILGASYTGFARSTDGGKSFEDMGPMAPGDEITFLGGDPVLALDTRGKNAGTLYLASLSDTLALGVSKDHGESFEWRNAVEPIGGAFHDKEWIAVDNTGGPFDGTIYLAWTQFGGEGAGIRFSYSRDEAETWSKPVTLDADTVQGARPAVGPDGEVYVVWERMTSGRSISIVRSDDGGASFSKPQSVASLEATGHTNVCIFPRQVLNGDIRTQEFPSIAVDTFGSAKKSSPAYNPYRGTVYVVFASRGEGLDESDVMLTYLSPKSGRWSEPKRINDDDTTTDQFFPEVVAIGPGRAAIAWTDRRGDATVPSPAGNRMMTQQIAFVSRGGAEISKNEQHSDVAFAPAVSNPNTDPMIAWCYQGDYNGLFSDGKTVISSWGDNRDSLFVEGAGPTVVPDPNVYFRRVPVR